MTTELDKAAAQNTQLIDQNTLGTIADYSVWSEKGEEIKFGSLYAERKTVVVFIRHFFCGMCQNYLIELAKVPKESFEAANTDIIVVGCGEWALIKQYKEDTGYYYPIYADPSRKLYKALGLIASLAPPPSDAPKKSYVGSVVSTTIHSTLRALKSPIAFFKGGDITQLGGDFILGPGNHCSFASRMRWTTDHVEVPDLMAAAGVPMPK